MKRTGKKTIGRFLTVTLIASMLLSCFGNSALAAPNDNLASAEYTYRVENPYVYPVTPAEAPEVWESFKTHDEMVNVCQIPEQILSRMTTPQLLKACVDYPMFGDVLLFNSYDTGFTSVYNKFGGLQELFKRNDLGTELVKYFQSIDLAKFQEEVDYPTLKLAYICVLVSQDQVLQLLSQAEYEAMVAKSKALRNEISEKFSDYYSPDALVTLESRIMAKAPEIFSKPDFSPQDVSTTVQTPNGSTVYATMVTTELTTEQYNEALTYVQNNYPNATIDRYPTKKYNCHSYAWHNQSSSNNIWINAPQQRKYWTDGSYSLVAQYTGGSWPSGIVHGMKVDYVNSDHSARVYNSTTMISKWGASCLVRHPFAYCPYTSTAANFYD